MTEDYTPGWDTTRVLATWSKRARDVNYSSQRSEFAKQPSVKRILKQANLDHYLTPSATHPVTGRVALLTLSFLAHALGDTAHE